ncbi:TspO/MBR family protein [Streptomyces sp. ODS05-4]|uniref:TspO/MBR family protein n=1 Tax=Streptomyces sp. ODS05-4 TaxID=2944939 RepID=UPI00210D08F9|nr:TspO/MBR family protein [Streptomyces sp. ODS05-4]
MNQAVHGQPPSARGASRWPLLLLFLGLCFAVAAIGGAAAADAGSTYTALERPGWAPPSWLFGPVWTVLYAMIAVSAWLAVRARSTTSAKPAMIAWGAQLALNLAWTPLFFAADQYGLAFLDILLLLAALAVTMLLFHRRSPAAALLLVPYAVWVAYATALNLAIWQLNT